MYLEHIFEWLNVNDSHIEAIDKDWRNGASGELRSERGVLQLICLQSSPLRITGIGWHLTIVGYFKGKSRECMHIQRACNMNLWHSYLNYTRYC